MAQQFDSVAGVLAAAGRDLGATEWMPLTQERINLFADATGDHQWIHVDEARAAAARPTPSTMSVPARPPAGHAGSSPGSAALRQELAEIRQLLDLDRR